MCREEGKRVQDRMWVSSITIDVHMTIWVRAEGDAGLSVGNLITSSRKYEVFLFHQGISLWFQLR